MRLESKIVPHKWQMECLNAWILNDCRGIVKAATGTGKSLVALMAMEYLSRNGENAKFAIIVPTKALQEQWRKNLIDIFGISGNLISLHGGGRSSNAGSLNNFFHLYTANTARDKFCSHCKIWKEKVFLIADECHRYGSEDNSRIFNARYEYSLGLSATPERYGDFGFEEKILPGLGKLVFEYGYDRAADDNVISPFRLTNIAVELTYPEKVEYENMSKKLSLLINNLYNRYPFLRKQRNFFACLEKIRRDKAEQEMQPDTDIEQFFNISINRKTLLNRAGNRMSSLIHILKSLYGKAKIIVFHELIEELDFISGALERSGIPHLAYHSGMKSGERDTALETFRNGSSKILLACKALDEGLDVPDTHVGIIVAASKTARQRIQRIGRTIRKSSGKDFSWIITLFAKDTIEEKFYSLENEQKLFGSARIEYLNNGFAI
ncbi:MAG: DEAD/DEAH box helicase [Lentisphaerota bacterium]